MEAKEKKGILLDHISKIYTDPKTKKEFYAVLAELDVIKELPLRQDVK